MFVMRETFAIYSFVCLFISLLVGAKILVVQLKLSDKYVIATVSSLVA